MTSRYRVLVPVRICRQSSRKEAIASIFMTLFLHENVQTEGVSIQFGGYDAKGSHCHADFEAELGDFEQLCHHSPKVHLS